MVLSIHKKLVYLNPDSELGLQKKGKHQGIDGPIVCGLFVSLQRFGGPTSMSSPTSKSSKNGNYDSNRIHIIV